MCGHTAFVRPDHLEPLLLEWRAYEFNSTSKESAKQLHWHQNIATDAQKTAWDALCTPLDHLPVRHNVNKSKFALVSTPICRNYAGSDVKNAVIGM